ncbi:hypothetical protein [Streptomyces soliscabiei]|nr:hypothetical protein [Streptomyces sp. NY05-11A]MDX2675808.1 hypothetical protein [Streptomyces sp. NY05-11A]
MGRHSYTSMEYQSPRLLRATPADWPPFMSDAPHHTHAHPE